MMLTSRNVKVTTLKVRYINTKYLTRKRHVKTLTVRYINTKYLTRDVMSRL